MRAIVHGILTNREIRIFLIVGCTTVLVDFLTYRLLLWTGWLDAGAAKAVSYITGTCFAYIANRLWTFGTAKHSTRETLPRFVLLYACTLGANVLVNSLVLAVPLEIPFKVTFAFLTATGVSTVLNFLGMKFFVFRTRAAL